MIRMMNKITKKLLACAIVCAGCSTQAIAQGWTPAGMEWLKEQRLWFQSQNAAGTVFDNTDNYSDVKLNYQRTGGNFARPQEGADEQSIGVSSEGFLNLDDAYVWGAFSFRQENKWDAGYNASITDPFRGMPYYVADKYLSDWRNQYYDLSKPNSSTYYAKIPISYVLDAVECIDNATAVNAKRVPAALDAGMTYVGSTYCGLSVARPFSSTTATGRRRTAAVSTAACDDSERLTAPTAGKSSPISRATSGATAS